MLVPTTISILPSLQNVWRCEGVEGGDYQVRAGEVGEVDESNCQVKARMGRKWRRSPCGCQLQPPACHPCSRCGRAQVWRGQASDKGRGGRGGGRQESRGIRKGSRAGVYNTCPAICKTPAKWQACHLCKLHTGRFAASQMQHTLVATFLSLPPVQAHVSKSMSVGEALAYALT